MASHFPHKAGLVLEKGQARGDVDFGAADGGGRAVLSQAEDKHLLWRSLAGWCCGLAFVVWIWIWLLGVGEGALVPLGVLGLAGCATCGAAAVLAALVLVGDRGTEGVHGGYRNLIRLWREKYS